jgi:hypothetical protein
VKRFIDCVAFACHKVKRPRQQNARFLPPLPGESYSCTHSQRQKTLKELFWQQELTSCSKLFFLGQRLQSFRSVLVAHSIILNCVVAFCFPYSTDNCGVLVGFVLAALQAGCSWLFATCTVPLRCPPHRFQAAILAQSAVAICFIYFGCVSTAEYANFPAFRILTIFRFSESLSSLLLLNFISTCMPSLVLVLNLPRHGLLLTWLLALAQLGSGLIVVASHAISKMHMYMPALTTQSAIL